MILSSKCAPTVIFIGFSLIQILIDIYKGVIEGAFMKFIIMLVLATVINILCDIGYSVIAWFLVFIPIIMMTLISTLLLKVVGSSPDDIIIDSQSNASNGEISNNRINKSGELDLDNSVNEPTPNDPLDAGINDIEPVDRLDRNSYRKNFYDKVDDVYGLTITHEYDLSNNPTKYNIVDNLINILGDNHFTHTVSTFYK
jgi:hypothetical protein